MSDIVYRADGQMTSYQMGNGLSAEIEYDLQGRREQQTLSNGSITVFKQEYTYDNNGNITNIDRTPNIAVDSGLANATSDPVYEYDFLNRLTDEAGILGNQELDYDENGNRERLQINNDSNATETYRYLLNSNRLTNLIRSESAGSNGTMINFGQSGVDLDNAGNTVREAFREFTYNNRNQVSRFTGYARTLPNNVESVADYQYDYQNRRTQKSFRGSDWLFAYDQSGNLLTEYLDQSASKSVIWIGRMPIAHIQYANDGSVEDLTYVTSDHLNTPRVGTNQSGVTVWQWHSDAFGTSAPNVDVDGDGNIVDISQRFPGQYYDEESGLHYNWNRYYDPAKGRYVTSDPIGLEGGLNTYGYVAGNPLKWFDQNGLIIAVQGSFPEREIIREALESIRKSPLAADLAELEFSDKVHIIRFPNQDEPADTSTTRIPGSGIGAQNAQNGFGVDTTVVINPTLEFLDDPRDPESDLFSGVSVLAHELLGHSLRADRGVVNFDVYDCEERFSVIQGNIFRKSVGEPLRNVP